MAGTELTVAQKLVAALEKCSALRDVPGFRAAEPEAEAWEALRAAVAASRREPSSLDLPRGEAESMADALELVAKTWRERRVLRGRAAECLRALLARDAWLWAAQARPGLAGALAEPLAESPELQARLQCPVPGPATGSSEPKRRSRRPSSEAEAGLAGIREALLRGRDAMRGFDWEFPRDPKSTKLDTATEAFMAFYDGLTRLGIILRPLSSADEHSGAPSDGGRPDLGLEDGDWPGVLRFLASMYSCGSRKTYRSRIKFVGARLEELCAGFVAAAEAEPGARFWSLEVSSEAPSHSQAAEAEGSGSEEDFDSLSAHEEGDEAEGSGDFEGPPPPGHVAQYGKLAVHNGMDREIVLFVEETQRESRVKPGKTAILEAEAELATVRINFVGLLGFTSIRTRLARAALRHQNCYTVFKDEHGNTVVREA